MEANNETKGIDQKETLVAGTEPENSPSERVLLKAGFRRGDLVKGAFEVTDLVTGLPVKKDATIWHYDRPVRES
jgi:RimJ/RimL family protein N-acetyltransferase